MPQLDTMQLALTAVSDAVVWTDRQGQIQWCNPSFQKLLRFQVDPIGRSLVGLLPLDRDHQPVTPADHPVTLAMGGGEGRSTYRFGCQNIEVTWTTLNPSNSDKRAPQPEGALLVICSLAHPVSLLPERSLPPSLTTPPNHTPAQISPDLGSPQQLTQAELQHSNHQLSQNNCELQTEIAELQSAIVWLSLYQKAINACSSGIMIADAQSFDTPLIYVNPAFERQTGYTADEVLGQNCRFLHRDDREQAGIHVLREALRRGRGCTVTLRNYRKDGTLFWNELTLSPIYDANRKLAHFVGIQTDVSGQKQTEVALRESEERLRLALEFANMGVWDLNLATHEEIWSPQSEALFGFAPGEFDHKTETFMQRIHPADREIARQAYDQALKTGQYRAEFRIVHPDQSIRWISTRGKVSYDNAHNPIRMIGIDMDVTEQQAVLQENKLAEEALRQSEEQFRKIFEDAPIAISLVDPETLKIVRRNAAHRELVDYNDDALASMTVLDFTHPDDGELDLQLLRQLVNGAIPRYQMEKRFIQKNGSVRWASMTVSLIRDSDRRPLYSIGMINDITVRKQTEAALQRSKESLAEAQRIARLGNWEYHVASQRITWSNEVFRIFGRDSNRPEPTLHQFLQQHLLPEDRDRFVRLIELALKGKLPNEVDLRIVRTDGSIGWIYAKGQPTFDDNHQITRLFGIVMDISDRKQIEAELIQQKEHLRLVLDNIPQQVYWKDKDLVYQGCNRNWAKASMLDNPETVLGKTDYDILASREAANFVREQDRQLIDSNSPLLHVIETDQRFATADELIWLDICKIPIRDCNGKSIGLLGVLEDISERIAAEEQLKASLNEKEVLLKEIHHRVKNNLQMIFSLLNLQASQIQDPKILAALKDSQSRVKVMALIHEKLYQSRSLAKINATEYIRHLATDLVHSYSSSPSAIQLRLDVESIELPIDTIIPCGFIISELVSNAVKYAFSDGQLGEIIISFIRENPHQFALIVSDNGTGMPNDINISDTKSLGMQLINAFVHQLRGTLELDRTRGTALKITFNPFPED